VTFDENKAKELDMVHLYRSTWQSLDWAKRRRQSEEGKAKKAKGTEVPRGKRTLGTKARCERL
jgi:hypothetical protein